MLAAPLVARHKETELRRLPALGSILGGGERR